MRLGETVCVRSPLMLFVHLKTLSIYRQFIRNSLRNTSMIAKAFWISATHTNTNSRRRLLRSYKAFVYFGSRTSRPRPRLLMLPAQGGVASGVREDGSADISWAGMGPMTGTVSSKSWNAWLMSHPR